MRQNIDYSGLSTEQNNPASRNIDLYPPSKILSLINKEDARVARAVSEQLPAMEKAVKVIVQALKSRRRLFLIGAGTSGRLGVMEAAECPPTFNTPPSLIRAFMAGGRSSVFRSKEGAEDRGDEASRLVRRHVQMGDVVIGIAASGVTAFVREGLKAANQREAKTILVTCNPKSVRAKADVRIALNTGPEIIAGSTRLKAATATKMVLNALTVASMVQWGKVYGNWMVDLQPKSQKLRARAIRLIARLGAVSESKARYLLKEAQGNAKTAILMAKRNISRKEAVARLKKANGYLRRALSL